VTFIALFAVLAGGGGDEESPAGGGGAQPVATTPSSKKSTSSTKKATSKRYTVKAGDTPSSIAEEAGIPLDKLLELNPDIDPQALSPGQKLKLGP
jgi:LysM repeat protein